MPGFISCRESNSSALFDRPSEAFKIYILDSTKTVARTGKNIELTKYYGIWQKLGNFNLSINISEIQKIKNAKTWLVQKPSSEV